MTITTQITEQAIRSAVTRSGRSVLSNADQVIDGVKQSAISRMTSLINANSSASEVSSEINTQMTAIGLAIAVLAVGYQLISEQIKTMNCQRLNFDQERLAGIATFTIPLQIEETKLSLEQSIIRDYIALAKKQTHPAAQKDYLYHYMGVHEALLSTDAPLNYYSVLPYYKMSESLSTPLASSNLIDAARANIDLFFKSSLASIIQEMDIDFKTDSSVPTFFVATVQGKNYLNDRRAFRFILISLANILWNLQHPVDLQFGFSCSIIESIDLCYQAELFLNALLDKKRSPFIHKIKNMNQALMSMVHKIEFHVKALKEAYVYEQLNELNFSDINSVAHRTLRLIDKSILNLTFKVFNPTTKKYEPDDLAADNIAYTFGYLNLLLNRNKDKSILRIFDSFQHLVSYRFALNHHQYLTKNFASKTVTVIDVLILFCHMNAENRKKLVQELELLDIDSAKEFSTTLMAFYKKYIKQMKRLSEKELESSFFTRNEEKIVERTARRIIPIITLVLADYRVDVNAKWISDTHLDDSLPHSLLNGGDQVAKINAQAKEMGGYYYWSLSSIVELNGMMVESIDQLPVYQDRMTKLTVLIDNLVSLISQYHHYLQLNTFQQFLLQCLMKIKKEYQLFAQEIKKMDASLSDNENISRQLNGILRPMIDTIERSITTVTTTIDYCFTVLNKPDFIARQKQKLIKQLEAIYDQYTALFGEDNDIAFIAQEIEAQKNHLSLTTNKEDLEHSSVHMNESREEKHLSDPVLLSKEQLSAFKVLAQSCYSHMSLLSQCSQKGTDLLVFLSKLDEIKILTIEEYKGMLLELIKITAAYRTASFFSATYGGTRSAKPIIDAMRDPYLSQMLQIASIVFHQNNEDYSIFSQDSVHRYFDTLKAENQWSESYSVM